MKVTISHGYGPNTTVVEIGHATYWFSDETCVAFQRCFPNADAVRIRRAGNYSKTTSKHMGKFGVIDWPKVDDETFERLASGGPAT